MYYIAAPLFNKEQLNVIKNIEDMLDKRGLKYFSPREYGNISNEKMTPERMERIFDMNILMLEQADTLIAVIDDRDTGTIFEMGCAHAMDMPIISFSNQGHMVNVMLKHAVISHARGYIELGHALEGTYINHLRVSE